VPHARFLVLIASHAAPAAELGRSAAERRVSGPEKARKEPEKGSGVFFVKKTPDPFLML
jgi:hypothetical protein